MNGLYGEMVRLLRQGESFAVATIFDKSGSAPRSEGAKMLVRADGSIKGSVGGGRLEASAINLAKETIAARKTAIQSFDLAGEDGAGLDMICGGSGEILVDFIDAQDKYNLEIYGSAAEIVEDAKEGWLVTVLDKSTEPSIISRQQCLVTSDRTLIGKVDCDPHLLEELLGGPTRISMHSEALGEYRFLVEPLRCGGTLYVFGAGHISQEIAPLAQHVGFKTMVLDDRSDYANRERFPEPIETRVIDSFEKLPKLPIDGESYLVIVSRGHLHDKEILEQVLRSDAAYIGMIGSRRKRDLLYEEIISHGFARSELERVHAPIGTSIGAESPEELAVSIVGELIQARAERLSQRRES